MGLDIYVTWDSITEEEERKQYACGFSSGPEVGYIRESWGSLAWVDNAAREFESLSPYDFYADWNGYNGEELEIDTPEAMAELVDFQGKLKTFLADFQETDEARQAFAQRLRDVIALIGFAEAHKSEPGLRIEFD